MPASAAEIREKLKELNKKLKALENNYDNMSWDEIRAGINEIIKLKVELIGELPDVLGMSFLDWYAGLTMIDAFVESALRDTNKWFFPATKEFIKGARVAKELLEKRFNEHQPH